MSISPPSDILLDVAKAADPQKYRAAVEKLARASGVSDAEAEKAVTEAINTVAAAASAKAARASGPVVSAQPGVMAGRSVNPLKTPEKEFEAFFLRTFVESILPQDSEVLFGSGPAGDIWKSMLAEHLANELAQGTSFGIAEQIADRHKDRQAKPAAAASAFGDQQQSAAQAGGASDYVARLNELLSGGGGTASLRASGRAA